MGRGVCASPARLPWRRHHRSISIRALAARARAVPRVPARPGRESVAAPAARTRNAPVTACDVQHPAGAARAEDDQRAWKRRRVLTVAEPEPPLQEPDLTVSAVLMPPTRIDARRHETHQRRPGPRRPVSLSDPPADAAPVWRIHPARTDPRLCQAVVLLSEVPRTLRVVRGGAHVQREPELGVQLVEEILRCRPFGCRAREVQARVHAGTWSLANVRASISASTSARRQ
jgi:hypothetical protein